MKKIKRMENSDTWTSSFPFFHYYKSWFFKRFKLINYHFLLMAITYILAKGQRFEWHIYLLTNQLDYNDLFD